MQQGHVFELFYEEQGQNVVPAVTGLMVQHNASESYYAVDYYVLHALEDYTSISQGALAASRYIHYSIAQQGGRCPAATLSAQIEMIETKEGQVCILSEKDTWPLTCSSTQGNYPPQASAPAG